MILHLIDDEKFIDATIEHFENVKPGAHIYMILKEKFDLKYIKSKDRIVFFLDLDMSVTDFFRTKTIKSVFIHFLSDDKVDFVTKAKKNQAVFKIVWFFWGADGYNLAKFRENLLGPKTRKLFNKVAADPIRVRIVKSITSWLSRFNVFIYDLQPRVSKKLKLIKNTDYIVPVIREDYDLLVSEYDTKAEYIDWNYLSIDQMLPMGIYDEVSGKNILLGNSAHPTNNHIEAIDILEKLDLKDRKVITPLSYGNPDYREHIIKYGKEKLGDSFEPLTDFLPLSEYSKIMRSCGFVIMNQNRQQAMGNIICSFYMGAKVFLNRNATMWNYFDKKNMNFCSIESLKNNSLEIDNPLSQVLKVKNREAIYFSWSRNAIADKTRALIEIVYN